MTQTQRAHQPAYRWVILAAICAMGFMTIGTRSTVSSFLKTIIADLGTNRETISFVVAMNIWLSGFAYHVSLSIWVFVYAGITALAIALLTVSYESFKAASINPVNSLRNE